VGEGGFDLISNLPILVLITGLTIYAYLQIGKSTRGNYSDLQPNMKRQSWFSFGFGDGGKAEAAKEEAARRTREADIRRLYEAGTQREVLEELYKPEEVYNCINQLENERKLLELLEEEAEAEASTLKSTLISEPSGKLTDDTEESTAKDSLVVRSNDDEAELGTTSEGSRISGGRFKLRFDNTDDEDDEDGVTRKTMGEKGREDGSGDGSKHKNIDVSLDDLTEGLDSVCMYEGGLYEEDTEQPPDVSEHTHLEDHESDDDLLKELLNTEGEESSHFDDSVTTGEGNLQKDEDSSVEASASDGTPENVEVRIDTSAVMRESVFTMDDSSQVVKNGISHNSSSRLAEEKSGETEDGLQEPFRAKDAGE
jgi:hypothetical protein